MFKIQLAFCFFIGFILISTLLSSFSFSGLNAYAQNNKTEVSTLPTETTGNDDDGKLILDKSVKDGIDKNDREKAVQEKESVDSQNSTSGSNYEDDNQNDSTESGKTMGQCPPGMGCNPIVCPDNMGPLECQTHEVIDPKADEDSNPYDSGFNHGCSDAKISDPIDRYINQPGKGSDNHTDEFMDGYNDGFDSCSETSPGDQNPVADAGPDKTITAGQTTILDGSKSYDPDGEIVKYEWRVAESFAAGCSDVTLKNWNSATSSFSTSSTISEKCSSYYELVVTDNDGKTSSDRVTITVNPDNRNPENQEPVANAGNDRVVFEGQSVTLDGSKSYDPDGEIVKYDWSFEEEGDSDCPYHIGSLDDDNSPTPKFIAIDRVPKECNELYGLEVTDNQNISSEDYILITVKPSSNQSGKVVVSDIHTKDFSVYVDNKFTIDATVENLMNTPIEYIGPSCGDGTLDIQIDKDIPKENIPICQSAGIFTLDPHESADVSSGIPKFIATDEGKYNAKVTFHYTADNISNEITNSFSFDVLPKQNETPPDENSSDTDFDRFPNAKVNDLGEIEIDYYVVYGDDGQRTEYNDNAEEIDNLQLYRNHMPGPIDGDDEVPKDVRLVFAGCQDPCNINDPDGIVVYLVPLQWSDKRITEKIIDRSDSDISNYKVAENRCSGTDPLEECSFNFDLDKYEDGTEIENDEYKLVINPGFDEEDSIYINEATVLTAE